MKNFQVTAKMAIEIAKTHINLTPSLSMVRNKNRES